MKKADVRQKQNLRYLPLPPKGGHLLENRCIMPPFWHMGKQPERRCMDSEETVPAFCGNVSAASEL